MVRSRPEEAAASEDNRRRGERLRLALQLHDDGVAMRWLTLRRQHPEEPEAQLRQRLGAWLRNHPIDDGGRLVERVTVGP